MIRHIYIHVPFCHRVCPYCSFYKHTPGGSSKDAFVDAVLAEARMQAQRHEFNTETIYLGGGTPTALSESHLERLLCGLRETFGHQPLLEFGLEANPRTVTASKAQMLKRVGINRVSLGVQAWNQSTLTVLGRDHSPEEAAETFWNLRDAGIPSLNVDLMFSIPGQTLADWSYSLTESLKLKPDHISAYNLNYEEDTEFFARLKRGEYTEEGERDAEMFFHAAEQLTAHGFEHYEVSNYALPGHHSIHNQGYWSGNDYLGLGPSAVSTIDRQRWKNIPDTDHYVSTIQQGFLPQCDAESLSHNEWLTERIALELRTSRGLPLHRIPHVEKSTLDSLQEHGHAIIQSDHLILTLQGRALTDPIATQLLSEDP
ncbi:MAG: radical SAM family heme chaperone HemW [Verrucomicrobiaceae bacterium]|nr:radical SAM family heme chaperone HemW [Verrucomicrobiaceae bacterium]